ncbi:MAG TPA: hypothetical protein VFS40_12530 [Gemmatimonadales bacterium]|nr:hypothetical protein [Gemmatimonadales bacterium]
MRGNGTARLTDLDRADRPRTLRRDHLDDDRRPPVRGSEIHLIGRYIAAMPLATFARLVGAAPKWCQNALATLGRPLHYTPALAEALGLARLIHATYRVPLATAMDLAEAALANRPLPAADPKADPTGVVQLVLDVPRYRSLIALRRAAVAAAPPRTAGRPSTLRASRRLPAAVLAEARAYGLDLGALRARLALPAAERLARLEENQQVITALRRRRRTGAGRPGAPTHGGIALRLRTLVEGLLAAGVEFIILGGVAGTVHGSARVTDDLDILFATTPDNLRRLAALLQGWAARPRGEPGDLPFVLDAQILRAAGELRLTTSVGLLDLVAHVAGVGTYDQALPQSEWIGELPFGAARFLSLDQLIAAKRAEHRPSKRDQLLELEALRALQE